MIVYNKIISNTLGIETRLEAFDTFSISIYSIGLREYYFIKLSSLVYFKLRYLVNKFFQNLFLSQIHSSSVSYSVFLG